MSERDKASELEEIIKYYDSVSGNNGEELEERIKAKSTDNPSSMTYSSCIICGATLFSHGDSIELSEANIEVNKILHKKVA